MDSEITLYLTTKIGHLVLEFQPQVQKIISLSINENAPEKPHSKNSASALNQLNHLNQEKIKSVLEDLNKYFLSAIPLKTISIALNGTEFQKAVWNELKKIPLGETRTYGDIAKKLNSSPRAVGNACRKNPIPLIVPCHRVISATGIGGFAGEVAGRQINIKRWLLNHEGVQL